MFCGHCGKEIEENAVFCGSCGTPVGGDSEKQPDTVSEVQEEVTLEATPDVSAEYVAQETVVSEEIAEVAEPVAEPVAEKVNESASAEKVDFAKPDFSAPAKKPNKKALGFVAVAAAVVALIFVVVSCRVAIKGFFIETFGSDDAYFEFVETNAFNGPTETISENYGKILDKLESQKFGTEASLKLNVGDKALSLVKESAGIDVDLAWLNDVVLNTEVNVKDGLGQVIAALEIDGDEIVDLDCILDSKKGEIFVGLLSLSDKYLGTELPIEEEALELSEILLNEDLIDLLPSESELNDLLNKYIEIIFGNLGEAKKSSETVKVGDIEEELTTLEIEIKPEALKNTALEVLKAVKEDSDIEDLIVDVTEYFQDNDLLDSDLDVYDELMEMLDETIDQLEGIEAESLMGDMAIVWTDYVGSGHEIVGRKLEVAEQEILRYVVAHDGSDLAAEYISQGIEIVGKGNDKGDLLNADYTVKFEGQKVCEITVIDYDLDSDYMSGTFRIKPASELFGLAGGDFAAATALSFISPGLEISIDEGRSTTELIVNVLSGDEVFVGFTLEVEETGASGVDKPDSDDVCELDEADEWLSDLDIDALIENLEDAGVPSELTDFIENAVENIM